MSTIAKTVLTKAAPAVLGLLSVAVLAGGLGLQLKAGRAMDARAEAYLAGPPPVVALDRFDAAEHGGAMGEALVTAQLDLERAAPIDPARPDGPPAFAVPLRAVAGAGETRALAIFTGPDYHDGRITAAGLATMAEDQGKAGPILSLNGWMGQAGDWAPSLVAAQLPADGPVLYPFVEGRRAAYAQGPAAPSLDIFCMIAAALGIAALGLVALTRPGRTLRDEPSYDAPPLQAPRAVEIESEALRALKPPKRSPVRTILAGVFIVLVLAAGVLSVWPVPLSEARDVLPDVSALSIGGLGDWASMYWNAALAGDRASILVVTMGALILALGAAMLGRAIRAGAPRRARRRRLKAQAV